ncbi:MAG: hypothetical protein R3D00_06105 [Bacteroidia bacterium]
MIFSRKPNTSLPDYVFTERYEAIFVFEVDIIAETDPFLRCLQSFLKKIGQETFWVKNAGEFYLPANTQGPALHLPIFEKCFDIYSQPPEINKELILTYSLGKWPLYYLDIAWDGAIEGETLDWALHFERPGDLAIFGMKAAYRPFFEQTFLQDKTMLERYMTDLRFIQAWVLRDETQFQTFIRNYFPSEIEKYKKK